MKKLINLKGHRRPKKKAPAPVLPPGTLAEDEYLAPHPTAPRAFVIKKKPKNEND